MNSSPKRNRRLESALSLFILLLLCAIAVGVLIKRQSETDLSRFGIVSLQQSEANQAGPALKVPPFASFIPPGFVGLLKPEVYEADNLYEKIDGKAPFYIDAGFVRLLTQRFARDDDEQQLIELFLFDMGSLQNAFCVYSLQRRPDVAPLPGVTYGYQTSNAAYFVHGKYYVELIGSLESTQLLAAARQIAERIRKQLPSGSAQLRLAELELFPSEHLVDGSFKFSLDSAFGFSGLTDTFSCRYEVDGRALTAFFSRRRDTAEAEKLIDSYAQFLLENDAVEKAAGSDRLRQIQARVFDFFGATEIVFVVGPFAAGIHEADDLQVAEQVAVRLAERLRAAVQEASE